MCLTSDLHTWSLIQPSTQTIGSLYRLISKKNQRIELNMILIKMKTRMVVNGKKVIKSNIFLCKINISRAINENKSFISCKRMRHIIIIKAYDMFLMIGNG